jgi:glycerophosphoryl diester phosphodiesterase
MKIIGHRGARGLAPENTIASLRKALEHHVDELEFDLRVTKDKVVILHHYPDLIDPKGEHHRIADCMYKELILHKPDLATFEAVLKAIGHPVPLYVEVKRKVPVEPIVKIIRDRLSDGWKNEHFLLGSKSQKTLLALHHTLPNIQKIVIEPWSGVRAVRRARQVNTRLLSMNQLWLWRGFISPMARRGWQLSAYTLNDTRKARRWEKYGLYGVITDYPDLYEKR